MTRPRLRNLLIAVAVLALLMSGVKVRPYPSSIVSMTEWGGDLYWHGYLIASANKVGGGPMWSHGATQPLLGRSRAQFCVTLGGVSTNVEMTIRLGK